MRAKRLRLSVESLARMFLKLVRGKPLNNSCLFQDGHRSPGAESDQIVLK